MSPEGGLNKTFSPEFGFYEIPLLPLNLYMWNLHCYPVDSGVPALQRVDPGFPIGGGANPYGERQHMILPNFPQNCMILRKFWAVGNAPRSASVFMERTFSVRIRSSVKRLDKPEVITDGRSWLAGAVHDVMEGAREFLSKWRIQTNKVAGIYNYKGRRSWTDAHVNIPFDVIICRNTL